MARTEFEMGIMHHNLSQPRSSSSMSRLLEIQSALNAFYVDALAQTRFQDEHLDQLSLPLLLSISQEYLDAPLRVMFVGKETNGWCAGRLRQYYEGTVSLETLLGRYQQQMATVGGQGAFMKALDAVAQQLTGLPRRSVMWSNVMKMDWPQGRSDSRNSFHHSEELRNFSAKVLRYEVELLKPDVILFGCGATYNAAIKAAFPIRTNREPFVRKALWCFDVGDIACCRLRHPQARPIKGTFEQTRVYYDRAIDIVKRRFAHRSSPHSRH